ncbi:MAG: hypothetical protein IJO28_04390 [Oscillospiraceae bacterium]|nr:hypothetical protein [Oscillospiraceae bacterium]
MDSLLALKTEQDGFEVQFELLSPLNSSVITNPYQQEISEKLESVNAQLDACNQLVAELNKDIDRLTNHADGLDYAVSVISGLITGIIDSVFVGEWNFKNAKAITNQEVNNKVAEFVKKDPRYIPWCKNTSHGRNPRDPNRLESAIEFLEEHYHLPGDGAYMSGSYGIRGVGHRLDDFCHHPTLIGLICSIAVQFTETTRYNHSGGKFIKIPIEVNQYGNFVGTNKFTKVMAGVINWCFTCAKTITNWKGHLMSDIATSAGLPGPLLSLLKELTRLPCFKDGAFAETLRKAYENGIGSGGNKIDLGAFNQLFEGASSKFDLRTEQAIAHELKRQAIPVLINEALVRGFYFIRRFIEEARQQPSLSEMNWKNILPFRNRTIVRMMTIATGTFTAVDMADAAIRSGGINAACLLRVNFVGVGRFAIAIGTDVGMGIKRGKLQAEKYAMIGQQLDLLNVKISYLDASAQYEMSEAAEEQSFVWKAAEDTVSTLIAANNCVDQAIAFYKESLQESSKTMNKISQHEKAFEKNPNLKNEMLNITRWGGQ